MLIVADTSPLNYLVLIGCIEILPRLHQEVLIPSAVRREPLSVSAFGEAMDRLKKTSFRYPSSLVERLLAEHNSGI